MGSTPLMERAYPKRKRAEVKYYESDSDDDVSDDGMEDDFDASSTDEEPAKKKLKGDDAKAKVKIDPNQPLPKQKIFPFARLPAELKNQIYDLTLRDKKGIYLSSKTRHYRRTIQRDVPSFINSSSYSNRRRSRYGYYYGQSPAVDTSADPVKLAALVPNIMLLNREIYAETQPILYASNTFFLEDTTALHAFLGNIGAKNVGTLTELTIKGWGYTKAHKAMNHPAFTLLASAVNLKRMHLDCRVHWGGGPEKVARQFYREAFHYLEGVGAAKGVIDAAVGVIEVLPQNLETYRYVHHLDVTPPKPTPEEDLEEFRAELRKLLSYK